MASRLTSDEVMAQLHAIERGEVTLTSATTPASEYCTNVDYRASNGWLLTVFNDCNDWDYLDSATAPDGRRWDFDDGTGDSPWAEASAYRPPDDVSERAFGIPATGSTYQRPNLGRWQSGDTIPAPEPGPSMLPNPISWLVSKIWGGK